MQTHMDNDFPKDMFIKRLHERAEKSRRRGDAHITAGAPGEEPLREWQSCNVHVRQMPPDEQDILRISIGGGNTLVPLNYLVFRGNHGACVDLLRRALAAMENPND